MRPNVICIVLDTARADALEPYGAPAGASPALADLAVRGQALDGVHATSCWTLPSHASMFTGLLPRGLGLTQAPATTPQSARPIIEAERDRLLPEVLRRNGYETAAVSANFWVSELSGFEIGFERFAQLDTSRHGRIAGGRRQRVLWPLEAVWGRADDGADDAGAVLARWIDAPPGKPFFWFVNLVECHSPYLPPRPYHAVSAIERLRAANEGRRHLNLNAIWRACVAEFDIPEEALQRMRRLYAGSVRYVDDWMETLLGRLDRAGLLDDTLVIVCSDHGENLGEGGLIAHAFSLDQRLIHVPFIVAGPGASSFAGMRSLAQLPLRVAQALGLEDAPWGRDETTEGVPVAQWDPPAPASDPRVQGLVREWGLGQETAERLGMQLTAAVDGRWKLVRRGEKEEMFDLEGDPLELSPLSAGVLEGGEASAAAASLRAALDGVDAAAERQPTVRPAAQEELDEIEDRMRLLGYL